MSVFDTEAHKIHRAFYRLLVEHGERYPKKHGEWRYYRLSDKCSFLLDTWNSSISKGDHVRGGRDIYGNIVLFRSRSPVESLASDFGGFTCKDPANLRYWYETVKMDIFRSKVKQLKSRRT